MKKLVFIFILFAFCAVKIGFSMPNYTGTRGLRRVISAEVEPKGRFNYIFGARAYWDVKDDSLPLDSIPLWDKNDSLVRYAEKGQCIIADIPLGVGFSFTDYLSLNLFTTFLGDIMRTANVEATDAEGSAAVSYGWGDMWLGLNFVPTKLFFAPEFAKLANFGIYPLISFPMGEKRKPPPDTCAVNNVFDNPCRVGEGGLHRFYTAGGMTFGGQALLTLNLGTVPKLPIHFNAGYQNYPEKSKYSYGVGFEVIYPKFAPFLEVYGEHRVDKKYDDGGIYLSPGLRFETAPKIWMTLTVDFNLTGEPGREKVYEDKYIQVGFGTAPAWAFNFTLSQGFDFMPPPPPEKAVIAGKVMDATDGSPVPAKVFLGDMSVTTDADGNYEFAFAGGKIVAYASPLKIEEYKPSPEVSKYISPGTKEIINFRVERKEVKEFSTLTGKVIDKVSRKPCIATISFPETNFPGIKSDENGVYRTELPSGTYVVKVDKSGYIPQTQPVVLKPGATSILDFELTPSARFSTLAGKVVDYATRKGVRAVISFPGTEIPDIYTDPETGTYKAEVPAGTHQVKVTSDGYVPEGVVVVCEPEATTVMDFELFKKEERIILHGITFEYNSATIRPSSYPVLDEAVELLKRHPEIRVEIGGHTCNIGSDSYNLELSYLRAESVKRYLVEHGIDSAKLTTKGYGESQPISSNATEAGRSQNRRIEFKILSQ